ncbi:MAG: hypothetical protein D6714_07820 [Bacteroidetes bacterium]|nr:MAG: hypothetical protein D6714_07820 [Bacteroidota bacterium]
MCAFVKKGTRRGAFSWGWVSAGALASAMSLAGKYDFIPAMLWVCAIAWHFRQRPGRAAGRILGFLWMCFLFFEVGIGFQNETLRASFEWLFTENRDLIARDRHWVYNPLLYLIAIAVGTSLPVFVFFVKGCGREWRRGLSAYFSGSAALFWLFVFVAMEGLVLWNLDAPFVRRANIFMPFVALMAAAGLDEMRSPKKRKAAIWATILYTYALTAVSQFNFIKDPRYAARDYLFEKIPAGTTIYYDPYARMKNTPPGTDAYDQADFVVLHESGYRRYWKSFTTPFGVPDCCEEVYHCASEKICLWTQEILKGSPKYELVARYAPLEVFPERLLYKGLFGTYETFMGEVRIYRKK